MLFSSGGISRTDVAQLDILVHASENGYGLFKGKGFKEVSRLELDLGTYVAVDEDRNGGDDLHLEVVYAHRYMLRKPVANGRYNHNFSVRGLEEWFFGCWLLFHSLIKSSSCYSLHYDASFCHTRHALVQYEVIDGDPKTTSIDDLSPCMV